MSCLKTEVEAADAVLDREHRVSKINHDVTDWFTRFRHRHCFIATTKNWKTKYSPWSHKIVTLFVKQGKKIYWK